ncbi:MAG: hypothetical protein A2Z35_01965 [Actinobacteria bacterium RBG_19FT_COMBO_36_27]|nr:MAG: hypothetical protein A2Z35_01965 [Actinobacteria bacterium RBG_19FT_COMBO_36_27]
MKNKPLRIGYLSADFQNHPVNHLLYPLYKNHTRPDFMIFAYSFGENDFSSYRLAVEKGCDRFFDITKLHPLKAAEKIHSDKINILVDLMGYTRNSRPNILALKPAPIQISYLGYPGTTGSDFIDYIITDPILTPTNQQKYYTEKFIYIPDCYQVNHRHAISKTKYTRKDYNLPEKGIVFASFNKTGKINPDLFKTWMNILLKVENSVLWLSLPTESQQILNNLKTYSKKYKVNVNRLIFTAKVPLEDHLKRLQLADLALDTTIYSGGVTTSNALLAGIPVLTLQGKHYLSRMSSSLIHAVGMDEMVTHSLADYENLAIKIGNDKALIQNLKQKLKQKVNKSNLYDIKSFTINIEEAYKVVWEHFAKNLPPKQFVIKAK